MKELLKTKVTVRLRKAEFRKEWYIYLESYPVMISGKKNPQRIREYLNRSVTTVEFDKKRPAKTTQNSISYKPKRDDNGIIVCKSESDRETMLYADSLRKLRQREYDSIELYSELDQIQAEQKEKSQENFVKYFEALIKRRHKNNSESIKVNWERAIDFLISYEGAEISFSKIDIKFCEAFKAFLLNAPRGGNKSGILSQNSASTYFSVFKAALKQAFIDGYFTTDIAAKIKSIPSEESRREYLTIDELNILVDTPCENDVLKRAVLFSALTGLRHSDIQKLKWNEISIENNQPRINFTQKKTKGVEYMPISQQALEICGEPKSPNDLVFENLTNPAWINRPLKTWVAKAGIQKNITFHCFRHTFATLQLSNGTDIYTVSKMLGHTNVKTTQVYAKVIDEKKNKAAEAIKLNL
ncbi:site-specific integrase [Elizabethkingia anophelis]|uniref:site-specific integrase n=1 Tax=Elizabethkingia anophelis TaxID=1117645 RepID=UPI0009995E24|nr:site-specific integrase [Elizabethkingia anophelis]MCT3662963.1 site-specific integrase [Elizabethkingia anophelis]MCT3734599.1 site-specific integrase [Elizabethkingia anophelis]MDV3871043.1 recombinase [Elizabethkingia anophelis]MDV4086795.1 recombinase [Elizabethkingia anophelis]MDV4129500.1 recombinase [Elizabethkingia anophelis]